MKRRSSFTRRVGNPQPLQTMLKKRDRATAAGKPAAVVDPGRKATQAEARAANGEAIELLKALAPLNLLAAAEYVRSNPPSAEAVATLAFLYQRLIQTSRGRSAARAPRPTTLSEKIRRAGVRDQRAAKDKLPREYSELMERYGPFRGKQRLNDAIYKAWRKSQ